MGDAPDAVSEEDCRLVPDEEELSSPPTAESWSCDQFTVRLALK